MGLASFNRIRREQAAKAAAEVAPAPVTPPAGEPPATVTEAPSPVPPAGESVPAVVEETSAPPASGEQLPPAELPPVASEPAHDAPPPEVTPDHQQPEKVKAWAAQNIETILARVQGGEITVDYALTMEKARGDEARPTLIRRLTPQAD